MADLLPPRPAHLHTDADALALAAHFEADWRMALDPAHIARDARNVLTPEYEGLVMRDYGPEAIVRYYAPTDPRLDPIDSRASAPDAARECGEKETT